jgi:hypothetical protein
MRSIAEQVDTDPHATGPQATVLRARGHWAGSALGVLRLAPRSLGSVGGIVVALLGLAAAGVLFLLTLWAWGVSMLALVALAATFDVAVGLFRRVAILEEGLTPKLAIHGHRVIDGGIPQPAWDWLELRAGAGIRVSLLKVTNHGDTPVHAVRAQIATLDPKEVSLITPYPLRWFIATGHASEEQIDIGPGGSALLILPPMLGHSFRDPGPWTLVVEVWSDDTAKVSKHLRTTDWRTSPHPAFTDVQDA